MPGKIIKRTWTSRGPTGHRAKLAAKRAKRRK